MVRVLDGNYNEEDVFTPSFFVLLLLFENIAEKKEKTHFPGTGRGTDRGEFIVRTFWVKVRTFWVKVRTFWVKVRTFWVKGFYNLLNYRELQGFLKSSNIYNIYNSYK